MSNMTNFQETELRRALYRTTPWAARINSTAYVVGDILYADVIRRIH